jgi:hypothetical protein
MAGRESGALGVGGYAPRGGEPSARPAAAEQHFVPRCARARGAPAPRGRCERATEAPFRRCAPIRATRRGARAWRQAATETRPR